MLYAHVTAWGIAPHAVRNPEEPIMWSATFGRARHAQTTIPCHTCGQPLRVERTCHEVFMRCETCSKSFDINEYIPEMDDAMEQFMEGVYCDRV